MVTDQSVPTFLSAKVAGEPAMSNVTESPGTNPTSAAEAVSIEAALVPS